jgi:hypothetical protein
MCTLSLEQGGQTGDYQQSVPMAFGTGTIMQASGLAATMLFQNR